MIKHLFTCLLLTLGAQVALSQNSTAKIIDFESGEGLPNADVQINGTDNIISNAEGYFTIPEKDSADDTVLTISYLGYSSARMTVGELKNSQFIVKLKPGIFELQSVNVSNLKLNNHPDSIMVLVKRNLSRNYKSAEKPVKNMLFYREGTAFRPVNLKAEMTESTGYKKKELKATNADLKAFASKLISHPPQEYTDMLCNYYSISKTVNGKPASMAKFEVAKAVKLKDKNRAVELKDLQDKAAEIVFKHLDSTKYYRIKSGLFGTRDTVLYANGAKRRKDKVKKSSTLSPAKSSVMGLMVGSSLVNNTELDFVMNQAIYEYTYEGLTQTQDNEWVYIINFAPKKRKAKYTGTLYVSEKDYAVVRADYTLGKGKTLGGVNLKFLLGVKQSENVSRGTIIFKERENEEGYYLQYASRETGSYIYINRPLKFIEITDGDKDEVAFDLKVEANMVDKEEYFVMSRSQITEADFDKAKESEFKYITLDSYDPNTWKEYSAIEPLQEMKQFRTVD